MIKLCLDYTGVQGSGDPGVQGPGVPGVQGVQGSRDPGVQGPWIQGFRVHVVPGVQGSRDPVGNSANGESLQMTPTHTSAPLVKVNSTYMKHKV